MKIKNIETGKVIDVDVTMHDREQKLVMGRYMFGTRFWNKYGEVFVQLCVKDGKPILKVKDGWEFDTPSKSVKRAKKVAATSDPVQVEPEPATIPTATFEPSVSQQQFTQPSAASMDVMTTMFATMFGGVEKKVERNVMNLVEPIIEECRKAADKVPVLKVIEVHTPTGTHQLTTTVEHAQFKALCWLVNAGIPTYLYGPAGSGKNVLCSQVAEALGLKFYYSGALSDEFKLKGYGDASGHYVPTEFYHAFTNGGLFMLDEMDASDPSVLVAINAAISQRYVDFPVLGRIDAHPDFRIVSAGNTFGTGASMLYTGRASLDASTLNRFGYMRIGYDETIDAVCAEHDQDLLDFGHAIRKGSEICGVSCLMSYRQFTAMAQLKQCEHFNTTQAIEFAITKGLTKDELRLLHREVETITGSENVYTQALSNLL